MLFPEPYTEYQVWVRALVNGRESPNSAVIKASTDVDQPSAPTITNLTCFGTGILFVEWLRPIRFDKTVDFYRIYHRVEAETLFETLTIQASERDTRQRVMTFKKSCSEDNINWFPFGFFFSSLSRPSPATPSIASRSAPAPTRWRRPT